MKSSAANDGPSFIKRKINQLNHSTHEFVLELCIIATLLFCLNFWTNLPDLGIDPVWGRAVAAIGVLVLFFMITFRFKWPILVGLAGLVVYLGISHLQTGEQEMVNGAPKTETIHNQHNPAPGISTNYLGADSIP